MTAPVLINPEGFYEDGQLRLLLDLPEATLARGRREGSLKYTRKGGKLFYLGQWVCDWLTGATRGKVVAHGG